MSATNRGCERKAYDFYATPPETIRAFLANFDGISSGDRILGLLPATARSSKC